jgi:hypothetical protein
MQAGLAQAEAGQPRHEAQHDAGLESPGHQAPT